MVLYQTDQTGCWDASGEPLPCSGSGQDGELNIGRSWPEPRFKVAADVAVDRSSGLVWPRDAGLSPFPLSWGEALEFASELDQARQFGHQGWRLPTRAEFFSLVSHVRVNPAIVVPSCFSNLFNGYYWTGTPCARLEDQAWSVHLSGGRVVRGMKHTSFMVWPVCPDPEVEGGPGDRPDSEDASDRFGFSRGLVTDRTTGLTWLRQGNPAGRALNWQDALDMVRQMNRKRLEGRGDWRLPNIRELESLLDDQVHSPAVHPLAGFENVADFYWSSTTSVWDPAYAWTLYTRDGYIGVGYKKDPEFFAWPVCTAV